MGNLTPNFSRAEFECKGEHCCGHSAPMNPLLIAGLQELRDKLSQVITADCPVIVTSGFRCRTHDAEVARELGFTPEQIIVRNSPHCLGIAADIVAPLADPDMIEEVAESIAAFRNGGIGRYTGARESIVHLDVRADGPARWTE